MAEEINETLKNENQEVNQEEKRTENPEETKETVQKDNHPTENNQQGKGKKGKEKKKKSVGQEILSWVLTLLAAVVAALAIRTLIFEPVRVDGHSMDDTLADGEIMLVSKYDFSSTWVVAPWADAETQEKAARITIGGNPERFNVVICRYPGRGGTNFVKRVVGLPGDTVAFEDGWLYVNGEKQQEDYINADYRSGLNSAMEAYRVPAKGDTLMLTEDSVLTVNGDPWRWRGGQISGTADDGMKLTYDQGKVLINGEEVTREGSTWKVGGKTRETNPLEEIVNKEFHLTEDYFFVCGDHRNNSNDSRSVGPISRSMIIGHVRRVIFSDWRGIQ